MAALVISRPAGAGGIPSYVTTLSISWLNNQFTALSVNHGVVEGTWQQTEELENIPDLAGLIREAVQKTNYHGNSVSLLLASSVLAQQLVDVPPVKGAALKKVIQREAQQQKISGGEAAWTYQSSFAFKDVQRAVLHLMPKTLLDRLIQACEQNGLHLNSVVPVSAVLQQQLTRLPLDKADVALLAAETGGTTTVVVGRADGQLLLARTLLGNWNENAERLALDLKRTISYITQQYGMEINRGLWLFGSVTADHAQTMQRQIGVPVAVSPVEFSPTYWAAESAKLRPAVGPNFIGLELQQAPQRRVFARVVAVATAVILIGAIVTAIVLGVLARQEAANTDVLRKRAAQLEGQRQALEQRNNELAGKQQLIKLVVDDQHPPVPAWLLGYLSEAVPPDLAVTNFAVKWQDDSWKLHLAGALEGNRKLSDPGAFTNAVALLADRLANGPFHVNILKRSDREQPARNDVIAADGWPLKVPDKPAVTNQFLIEGALR